MNNRSFACACDACFDVLGPGDAVTTEGLCGFCARHCFPWGTLHDGSDGRLALVFDGRKELHRLQLSYGTVDPEQVNQRAMVRVGLSAIQAAAPHVAPHLKTVMEIIGRKIR